MTDFLVSTQNQAQIGTGSNSQYRQSHIYNPADSLDHAQKNEREVDLREALEWLLGPADSPDPAISASELMERKERRLDLLIWLMNLELRLSPYGDPA
ncbi:MAG: hypothetical protein K8F91_12440 [Candidatus Obscuribacterales bacterium]|nr:hypothetical protein [Candidatus Obscuribacterales bacterium]